MVAIVVRRAAAAAACPLSLSLSLSLTLSPITGHPQAAGSQRFSRKNSLQQEGIGRKFLLKRILPAEGLEYSC